MKDIEAFTGDNMGGIEKFRYIPADDVEEIPEANNHLIEDVIILKAGKQWYNAVCTLGTTGYSEKQAETDQGQSYDKSLTGFVPKDSPEMAALFDEMENQRYIIDYTDNNGYRKIIGSLTEPVRFKADGETKTDASGRNGHVITFYSLGSHKSYFYDPA